MDVYSFTSAFLFSIETQHTIGYGSRHTTGKRLLIKSCELMREKKIDDGEEDEMLGERACGIDWSEHERAIHICNQIPIADKRA